MKRITSLAAASIATIAALTACTATEGAPTGEKADTNSSRSMETGDDKPANDEPQTPTEPTTADFGTEWEYENGVTLSISKPVPFTPGEWAMGGEGYPHLVKYTVTIVNGSRKPLDVTLFDATVTSNGHVGESDVIDDANGVDMAPSTSVMPGQTISWDAGAGVRGLRNLGVTASPNWDYAPAAFGGVSS